MGVCPNVVCHACAEDHYLYCDGAAFTTSFAYAVCVRQDVVPVHLGEDGGTGAIGAPDAEVPVGLGGVDVAVDDLSLIHISEPTRPY